ncbi:MAG: BspA family leucine-rich repeat surface protein [Helicobacter sp.]|nr:BspA family leucine-rich repeat surface protein [Helicobacter sp.]
MSNQPQNLIELIDLARNLEINLGEIDTSKITNMNHLFFQSPRKDFSGIETWDTSKVEEYGRDV